MPHVKNRITTDPLGRPLFPFSLWGAGDPRSGWDGAYWYSITVSSSCTALWPGGWRCLCACTASAPSARCGGARGCGPPRTPGPGSWTSSQLGRRHPDGGGNCSWPQQPCVSLHCIIKILVSTNYQSHGGYFYICLLYQCGVPLCNIHTLDLLTNLHEV